MWLLSQLVVDVDLAPDVVHQVFLNDLVHLHAFKDDNTLGVDVACYSHNPDHTTANKPANLILSDLSIYGVSLVLCEHDVSTDRLLVIHIIIIILLLKESLILQLDLTPFLAGRSLHSKLHLASDGSVGRADRPPQSVLLAELKWQKACAVATLSEGLVRSLGANIGLGLVVLGQVLLSRPLLFALVGAS